MAKPTGHEGHPFLPDDRPREPLRQVTSATTAAPIGVSILLCSFNGERYLSEQLESLGAQSFRHWTLWVSDDGSTDNTLNILRNYQRLWGEHKLRLVTGPGAGSTRNFLHLACRDDLAPGLFAFCDQDDIWEADKLARAIDWLAQQRDNRPLLYCSRTRLIDENGVEYGYSPRFRRPPTFRNALMQNVGSGNTMVFNDATRRLLQLAGDDVTVPIHDWWVYLVTAACGGQVHYDPQPAIRYRQHADNQVGANSSLPARLSRINLYRLGRFKDWTDRNLSAMRRLEGALTAENRQICERFAVARRQSLLPRLWGVWRSGVYRQTLAGDLGLFFATLLGKI